MESSVVGEDEAVDGGGVGKGFSEGHGEGESGCDSRTGNHNLKNFLRCRDLCK